MPSRDKDYAKKLFRLVRILNRLEAQGKVSPRELARDFNVTLRTAQRDLELINRAEFPLVSMDKGSYSFMPGFSLKRLPLTSEEASLLAFLCEVARSMGGTFAKSFKSLMSRALVSGGGASPFYAISPVKPMRESPAMESVRAAVEDCREIRIVYANGKAHRLRPLKIVFSEGFWYLAAAIKGRAGYRTYRMDRIESVEELEETFEPPKNIEAALARSLNIWSGGGDIRVVLRVDPEVAGYFGAASYFPRQKQLKSLRDGSLILQARANHVMQVVPVIQRWIPHVHVLQPRHLRLELIGRTRSYLKRSK